jgi:hypothetical protein
MSRRVYGAANNPLVDHFLYKCSETSAADALAAGRAKRIIDREGRNAIQLIEGAPAHDAVTVIESVGLRALVPFARVLNPIVAPDKLPYEIPHAGDRTLFARHHRSLIRVSSRSLFNVQVLPERVGA